MFIGFVFSITSLGSVVYGGEIDNCKHEKSKWVTVQQQGCTTEGIKAKKCDICGATLDSKKLPELDHDYVDCICTRCGSCESEDEKSGSIILQRGEMCEANDIDTSAPNVVIPEKIQWEGREWRVTGLAQFFFENGKDSLVSCTLPEGITVIEDYAFDQCIKLKSVNFPSSLKRVGVAAFQLCSSLESLDLPDSLEYIGDYAFNHLTSLKCDTIKLPKNLKCLGVYYHYPAHMFYDCGVVNGLKHFTIDADNKYYKVIDDVVYTYDGKTVVCVPRGKVFKDDTLELPNTVENLGELSIGRNTGASTLVLSDNMKVEPAYNSLERWSYNNFGNKLSAGCYAHSGIKYYKVRDTNPNYIAVDGLLYTKDAKSLRAVPNEYVGVVNIIEGCEKIFDGAFWDEVELQKNMAMNKITEIVFPSTLKKIEDDQIEVINDLVDTYGVKLINHSSNIVINSNGHLE